VDAGLLDELMARVGDGELTLTGQGGFLPEMVKAVLDRGLQAELTDHLGYEKGDPAGRGSPNSRNGTTPKTLASEVGSVPLDVPRDTLGTELSHGTVSNITDAVLEEVATRYEELAVRYAAVVLIAALDDWLTCVAATTDPDDPDPDAGIGPGILGGVEYYADAEGGAYIEEPTHADVVQLIQELDTASNTFVVLYPGDETRDWFISVATRAGALGGYEIERQDRGQGQPSKTIATIPTVIATDVLDWISQR
jgi:hypothetical protein